MFIKSNICILKIELYNKIGNELFTDYNVNEYFKTIWLKFISNFNPKTKTLSEIYEYGFQSFLSNCLLESNINLTISDIFNNNKQIKTSVKNTSLLFYFIDNKDNYWTIEEINDISSTIEELFYCHYIETNNEILYMNDYLISKIIIEI